MPKACYRPYSKGRNSDGVIFTHSPVQRSTLFITGNCLTRPLLPSVGYYSTQGSRSNTPATQLVTLLYSTQGSHYSTHYSTQEVAGVTNISS